MRITLPPLLRAGVLCISATTLSAVTYYMAPPPLGDDANPGTLAQPWASIHKAASSLHAGDTVVLRGGTYLITNRVRFSHDGTPGAWITYEAWPGELPIFDATNHVIQSESATFFFNGCSYVRMIGVKLINCFTYAFHVYGANTHDIDLIECAVDQSYGPGIRVQYAHNVRVVGCEIVGANNTAFRPPWGGAGEAPHEAISISSTLSFEAAYNHVHHCYKEAIDIKGTSMFGVIHHNFTHDNSRQGLYADAWHGVLEDIEFHHNVSCFNEWGLALSVEDSNSELRNVRVHHNLLYRNRGSGLFFSIWGVNGPRSNIFIANNTVVANGRNHHWAGPTGGIDMKSTNCAGVTILNNLCAGNYAFQIATFDDPDDNGFDRLAACGIVVSNNLSDVFRTNTYGNSPYGYVYALLGGEAVTGDPRFVSSAADVYYLTSNSPAIDAGIADPAFNDPDGSRNDCGAFFFGQQDAPPAFLRAGATRSALLRLDQPTVPGMTYQLMQSPDRQSWSPVDALQTGAWTYATWYMPTAATASYYRSDVRLLP